MYMPFDLVTYTGDKFRGEIKDKVGEVVCPVAGDPGKYVVEFGDHSYILRGDVAFRRYTPSAKDREIRADVLVTHRRRRAVSEDEV